MTQADEAVPRDQPLAGSLGRRRMGGPMSRTLRSAAYLPIAYDRKRKKKRRKRVLERPGQGASACSRIASTSS